MHVRFSQIRVRSDPVTFDLLLLLMAFRTARANVQNEEQFQVKWRLISIILSGLYQYVLSGFTTADGVLNPNSPL